MSRLFFCFIMWASLLFDRQYCRLTTAPKNHLSTSLKNLASKFKVSKAVICNSPRNWALDARYSVPIMRFIHYISILNDILNISKFPKLWFANLCGSGLLMREALSQLCKNLEQIRFPLFISDSDFYRQHKTRNRQLRDLVLSLQSCWAHFLWLW